jgi:hypothetical protein
VILSKGIKSSLNSKKLAPKYRKISNRQRTHLDQKLILHKNLKSILRTHVNHFPFLAWLAQSRYNHKQCNPSTCHDLIGYYIANPITLTLITFHIFHCPLLANYIMIHLPSTFPCLVALHHIRNPEGNV